jgi:transcriptional regulator with XRE-family HTH domain
MKSVYLVVGESIRAYRLQRGLTLEDLAELSRLHASYIGQIERNAKKSSLETIATLAQALGVPVGALFSVAQPKRIDPFSEIARPFLGAKSGAKRKVLVDVMRLLSKRLRKLN